MRSSPDLVAVSLLWLWLRLAACQTNFSNRAWSGLSVLSIVPANNEKIYILNEKFTFTNGYYHGWILPSEERLQLNFTLFSSVGLMVSLKAFLN
jgi:hypothetical protein